MSNHLQSERSPEVSRGSRLLRMAFASLMSFAAIAGFAANASAQESGNDAGTITATVGSAISVTVGDVAFGEIVPNGGLEDSNIYARDLNIEVDSTVAWTADAAIAANEGNDLELTNGRMRIGSGAVPTSAAAASGAPALNENEPVTSFVTGGVGENDVAAFLTVQAYWSDPAGAALNATLTITVTEDTEP